MLHTPPISDGWEGHCTLWLHVIDSQAGYHDEDEPLSESPSCSSLLPIWTATPWPMSPGVDPSLTTVPVNLNASRPKRPPLTEAPATQHSGRAHHSESPVWLAACPAIGCVGQREQSRRQTPDSKESRVRRETANHRRWEFAQESPLCRVTEAQMEQGEKERMREREAAALLTHTCRKKEGSITS